MLQWRPTSYLWPSLLQLARFTYFSQIDGSLCKLDWSIIKTLTQLWCVDSPRSRWQQPLLPHLLWYEPHHNTKLVFGHDVLGICPPSKKALVRARMYFVVSCLCSLAWLAWPFISRCQLKKLQFKLAKLTCKEKQCCFSFLFSFSKPLILLQKSFIDSIIDTMDFSNSSNLLHISALPFLRSSWEHVIWRVRPPRTVRLWVLLDVDPILHLFHFKAFTWLWLVVTFYTQIQFRSCYITRVLANRTPNTSL